MENKVTLVVTAVPNPEAAAEMQAYLQGVMPLLLEAGGQLVKRMKVSETIHGAPAGIVMAMDFADAKTIHGVFASADYQALLPKREAGFKEMNIYIAEDL